MGGANPKITEHEANKVTNGRENYLDVEPVKHGRFKRQCKTNQNLYPIFRTGANKPNNEKKKSDGSGEAKVGAWDEVVMEAKEETSQGASGMPRDEKGLWGLRVRDPGSGTAGE